MFSQETILPPKKQILDKVCDESDYALLQGLALPTASAKSVSVLIGQDNADLLMPRDVRSGKPGEPYAVKTLLGWTLNGPLAATRECSYISFHCKQRHVGETAGEVL